MITFSTGLDLDTITIKNILNRKNSLRTLNFDQFEEIVERLAEELGDVDYEFDHSKNDLKKDWDNLKKFKNRAKRIASTKRTGLKLVEHFFPNVWEVKNSNGKSFSDYWENIELRKNVLRWNRKSHTTPYLSELRRGIYFCSDLPKTTLYRPTMAKTILDFYKVKRVFDPCAGWGGRLLGTCVNPERFYLGFEPNSKTYRNLNRLTNFLSLENCKIIHAPAEQMSQFDIAKGEKFDCILTSPPYYDIEVYSDEHSQSIYGKSYGEWLVNWLKPLIKDSTDLLTSDGISCWNTSNIGSYKLADIVEEYHKDLGFTKVNEFSIISSKRQVNRTKKKNQDTTFVFQRK